MALDAVRCMHTRAWTPAAAPRPPLAHHRVLPRVHPALDSSPRGGPRARSSAQSALTSVRHARLRYDARAFCLPWLPNRSVRANLDFAEGGDKAVRRIELHDFQAFFVHQDQLHHEVVTAYTVWQAIRLLLR